MRLLTSIPAALARGGVVVTAAPHLARRHHQHGSWSHGHESHRVPSDSQKNYRLNGTQRPGEPGLESPLVFKEYDLVIDNTPVAADGFL
jgi:hypothetical protein